MIAIHLPEPLADWIDGQLPVLGGVRKVRLLGCARLPLERLWRGQRYAGLTLWNRIYLRDCCSPLDSGDLDTLELLFHELIHVAQFARNPLWFPVRYLMLCARRGYRDNPMEIEARQGAAEMLERYRRWIAESA